MKRVIFIALIVLSVGVSISADSMSIEGKLVTYAFDASSNFSTTVSFRDGKGTSNSTYGIELSSERIILKKPDFKNQIRIDRTIFQSEIDLNKRAKYMGSPSSKFKLIDNAQFGKIKVYELSPEIGTARYIVHLVKGLSITTIALDLDKEMETNLEVISYMQIIKSIMVTDK